MCCALHLALVPRSAATTSLAQARAAVDQLRQGGVWPPTEVQPVLDILEKATRRFLAMPRGSAAARTGDELLPILTDFYEGLAGRVEAMRQAVLERDDDLQAFLKTPAYRERETLALTALYHLSWARYQRTIHPSRDKRAQQQLLRQAVRGFTEFVYVNEIPELYGDCLYGRALAFRALGETGKAREDLQAVLDLGPKHPAHARARVALDAIRRGKPIEMSRPVDRTTLELDRLRNLLTTFGVAAPASRAGSTTQRLEAQAQALALARSLASRNKSTAERVDRLVAEAAGSDAGTFVSFLRAELASDRGKHEQAGTYYGAAAAGDDIDADQYRARARFGIAAAYYRAGDYARAAAAFEEFRSAHPEADQVPSALYFRFKAIEALRADAAPAGTPGMDSRSELATDETYRAALAAYLEYAPEGRHAAEARYQLGRLHHEQGECSAALNVIGTPASDTPWELRGQFLVLQCQAQSTRAAWHRGDTDAAQTHYRAALTAAQALSRAAATTTDDPALQQLCARACLAGALLASAAPTPQPGDVLSLVGEFEKRFPGEHELAADAVALRALARTRLGQGTAARAEIDRLLELQVEEAALRQHLRHVGRAALGEAENSDSKRRRDLLRVAQAAYTALTTKPVAGTGGGNGNAATQVSDLAELGQIDLEIGEPAAAAQAYARMLVADPGSIEGLRGAALAAEAQGESDEALTRWRRLMEKVTRGETIWYEATLHAARMENRLGRPAAACSMLRPSGKLAPPSADGLAGAWAELEGQVCQ